MSNQTKIADLYKDLEDIKSYEKLLVKLDQQPPEEWVKLHPYIKGYRYLPIDKVEWLLKTIFKKFKIEILRETSMFNGVTVAVRVHYKDPVTGEMEFHDGIGAKELQVQKGASAADLSMINPGALVMACTIAKTVAIKDACDHFGRLFGSDLNRKEGMPLQEDEYLQSKQGIIDGINKSVEQPSINKEVVFNDYQDYKEPSEYVNNLEVEQPQIVTNIPAPLTVAETPVPVAEMPAPPDDDYAWKE